MTEIVMTDELKCKFEIRAQEYLTVHNSFKNEMIKVLNSFDKNVNEILKLSCKKRRNVLWEINNLQCDLRNLKDDITKTRKSLEQLLTQQFVNEHELRFLYQDFCLIYGKCAEYRLKSIQKIYNLVVESDEDTYQLQYKNYLFDDNLEYPHQLKFNLTGELIERFKIKLSEFVIIVNDLKLYIYEPCINKIELILTQETINEQDLWLLDYNTNYIKMRNS